MVVVEKITDRKILKIQSNGINRICIPIKSEAKLLTITLVWLITGIIVTRHWGHLSWLLCLIHIIYRVNPLVNDLISFLSDLIRLNDSIMILVI